MEVSNKEYMFIQNDEQPQRRNVPRWSVDRNDYRTELSNQINQVRNLKNSSKIDKQEENNRERETIGRMLNKSQKDQTVLEYERRRAEQIIVQENLLKARLVKQTKHPNLVVQSDSIKIPIVSISRNQMRQIASTLPSESVGLNRTNQHLQLSENNRLSSSVEKMNKLSINRSESSYDDDDPMMKQSEDSQIQLLNTFKHYQNKIDNRAAVGILQQTKMLKSKLSSLVSSPYQQKPNSELSKEFQPNYNSVLEAQIQQKKMEKLLSKLQDQEYRTRIEARSKNAIDFDRNYQEKQHKSKLEYFDSLKSQARDQINNNKFEKVTQKYVPIESK